MIPARLCRPEFRFVKIRAKEKGPFEMAWESKNNYPATSLDIGKWLAGGGNYGIVCGYGDLAVIDCDVPEVEQAVERELPKTFTVKTGSGKKHFYFLCPDLPAPIRLSKEHSGDMGDVRWKGQQVVAPGSTHPSGGKYEVINDVPIAAVKAEQIRFALRDLLPPQEQPVANEYPEIPLNVKDVIPLAGLKWCPSRGEYQGAHPLHGSEGGMNFTVNVDKNVWHCFRCGSGGSALHWVAVEKGILGCGECQRGALRGEKFFKALEVAGLADKVKLLLPDGMKIEEAAGLIKEYEHWKASWLVEGLIPEGALVFEVGKRASFKSWLVSDMICAVAEGRDWLGHKTTKTNVMIIDAENSPPLLADRLRKVGAGKGVYYYSGDMFRFEQHTDKLIAECKRLDVKLVAVDTFRRAHSADENDAAAISALFREYLFRFKLAGITLVLLYHLRKDQAGGDNQDDDDKIRGSSEFANLADITIHHTRKSTAMIVRIKQTKNRFGQEAAPFFVNVKIDDEKAEFTPVADTDVDTLPSMVARELSKYVATRKQGDIIMTEQFHRIADEAGLPTSRNLDRAITLLVTRGEIDRKRKGFYAVLQGQTTL